MEEINAAGKKQFEQWFQTKEGANELENAQYYGLRVLSEGASVQSADRSDRPSVRTFESA